MIKERLIDKAICYYLYQDLGKKFIIIQLINIFLYALGMLEEKHYFSLIFMLILSAVDIGN